MLEVFTNFEFHSGLWNYTIEEVENEYELGGYIVFESKFDYETAEKAYKFGKLKLKQIGADRE